MIFTSESGLTDPGRIPEWDEWYLGHLAAMVAVPGVLSAQRFRALDAGPPPSLAIYSVASPAVFDSDIYLRTRGIPTKIAQRLLVTGFLDEVIRRLDHAAIAEHLHRLIEEKFARQSS